MDEILLRFAITAFVMLIVVINPVAVAPVFVAVTRGMGSAERPHSLLPCPPSEGTT